MYVRNLNERVRCAEIKRRLALLVSRYARVVDVAVRRARRLRGQAFVTLGCARDAQKVKALLQNFFFLGTEIDVQFARAPRAAAAHRGAKTLVLKNLENASVADLERAFAREPGFARVRHVAAKRVAFVDFDDARNCERCLAKYEKSGIAVGTALRRLDAL